MRVAEKVLCCPLSLPKLNDCRCAAEDTHGAGRMRVMSAVQEGLVQQSARAAVGWVGECSQAVQDEAQVACWSVPVVFCKFCIPTADLASQWGR